METGNTDDVSPDNRVSVFADVSNFKGTQSVVSTHFLMS